ncbi:ribosome maturation factor RimM [Tepidibacillus decaturensis]|uniref:Ribosome maturation factor RimM n=1 Tax=Tepidibacillus decaturensis TaxID=1413211 RepID=A0A135L4B1_9BACI|nr:ribosome maturation factor RimM [Tepidibacillus decaturensis]KXG43683.1 ribosome maturation factor RimM [Tepidibacillus decaturensis]
MDTHFFKIGQIVNTFGIKGELKIYLHTDFPDERFKKGNQIFIGSENHPNQQSAKIQSAKPYKNLYLVKLEGYDNINQVEKYKGLYMWISKEQQHDLEEGEFYFHQIIGCKVYSTDGEEIGTVTEILSPGANDVWVVKDATSKKEILIPYVELIVKEVNVNEKKIIIEPIEGLLS